MLFSFCAKYSNKCKENRSENLIFIDLNQLYLSTILLYMESFINHSFFNKKGPDISEPFYEYMFIIK